MLRKMSENNYKETNVRHEFPFGDVGLKGAASLSIPKTMAVDTPIFDLGIPMLPAGVGKHTIVMFYM
jgi:hypothetical protein